MKISIRSVCFGIGFGTLAGVVFGSLLQSRDFAGVLPDWSFSTFFGIVLLVIVIFNILLDIFSEVFSEGDMGVSFLGAGLANCFFTVPAYFLLFLLRILRGFWMMSPQVELRMIIFLNIALVILTICLVREGKIKSLRNGNGN